MASAFIFRENSCGIELSCSCTKLGPYRAPLEAPTSTTRQTDKQLGISRRTSSGVVSRLQRQPAHGAVSIDWSHQWVKAAVWKTDAVSTELFFFFSGCLSFLISPLGESFRVALLSPRDSESKVNLPRVCLTMYCVFVVSLVFALQVQMKREDREYRRDHEWSVETKRDAVAFINTWRVLGVCPGRHTFYLRNGSYDFLDVVNVIGRSRNTLSAELFTFVRPHNTFWLRI